MNNLYATQNRDDDWKVYGSSIQEPEFELPNKLDEKEVMHIIKLVQKYFDEGAKEGTQEARFKYKEQVAELQRVAHDLNKQNVMLREQLRSE